MNVSGERRKYMNYMNDWSKRIRGILKTDINIYFDKDNKKWLNREIVIIKMRIKEKSKWKAGTWFKT